jgi:hypothetical protein
MICLLVLSEMFFNSGFATIDTACVADPVYLFAMQRNDVIIPVLREMYVPGLKFSFAYRGDLLPVLPIAAGVLLLLKR